MSLTVQEINDLVRIWTPRLLLFARQRTDAPEDAVQEAFLGLYRTRIRPDDVVAWLFQATRNAAVDGSRSRTRRRSRENIVAESAPNWFEPSEGNRLDAELVTEKLCELPSELREVVVARLWGELSFEQIGKLTKMSHATAHRRYHEAIETLRRLLRIDEQKERR